VQRTYCPQALVISAAYLLPTGTGHQCSVPIAHRHWSSMQRTYCPQALVISAAYLLPTGTGHQCSVPIARDTDRVPLTRHTPINSTQPPRSSILFRSA